MRASRLCFVSISMLLVAAPAMAGPSQPSGLRKSFEAIYHRMNLACDNLNIDALMPFFAADFVGVDVDNNVSSVDAVRQGMQGMFSEDRFRHDVTTIHSIKPWKNGIIVVAQTLMKYETDGGTLHMKVIETDEDYWIKRGGAWKLKQENELSVYTWHNGVPYEK